MKKRLQMIRNGKEGRKKRMTDNVSNLLFNKFKKVGNISSFKNTIPSFKRIKIIRFIHSNFIKLNYENIST